MKDNPKILRVPQLCNPTFFQFFELATPSKGDKELSLKGKCCRLDNTVKKNQFWGQYNKISLDCNSKCHNVIMLKMKAMLLGKNLCQLVAYK